MTKRFGSIRLRELYVWYVKSKGRGKAKATIGPKRAWLGLFAPNHLWCRVLKLPWPWRQWRWPSCTLLQGPHCTDGGPWNPEYLTFRSGKCQLHVAINPRFIFWYVNILHFGWNFNLKKKIPDVWKLRCRQSRKSPWGCTFDGSKNWKNNFAFHWLNFWEHILLTRHLNTD